MWHVDSYLGLDGSMWIEHRIGVDAIWTGVGLPREEMTAEERLEVNAALRPAPTTTSSIASDDFNTSSRDAMAKRVWSKEVRRAYYKKSLQWHPDRWVGMGIYNVVVRGVFELISEAYRQLGERKMNQLEL